MDTKQPEALAQECADYATSLCSAANVLKLEGREPPVSFLRCTKLLERAAARIAELEAMAAGYDAARLEIESLHAQLEAVCAGGVSPLIGASQAQPVAHCQPDDPDSTTAFSWPGTARHPNHDTPLYIAPQPAAQAQDARIRAAGNTLANAVVEREAQPVAVPGEREATLSLANDQRLCCRAHPHEKQDLHCQLREVAAWLRWHAASGKAPKAESMYAHAEQVDAVALELRATPAGMEPVARIEGIDEYGPRLEWKQHWVDVGVGANLFAAAQVQAMLDEAPRNAPLYDPDDVAFSAWCCAMDDGITASPKGGQYAD